MQGSILIYGGSMKKRHDRALDVLDSLNLSPEGPNVLKVEPLEGKKSIGIEQVREILTFLSKSPFNAKYKAVYIPQAEKITTEGQNTLLKTLEEPAGHSTVILGAKTQDSMLPTVVSRCRKVFAGSQEGREGEGTELSGIITVLNMNTGERLAWAEENSKEERDTIIEMLEEWVRDVREDLDKKPEGADNIKLITKVMTDLERTNLNAKLALEYLVINLDHVQ